MYRNQRFIIAIVVLAQLAGTSLWFAGNAVIDGMQTDLDLPADALGPLTSSVHIGFIVGTLTFAILTVADRFSPSRVFFTCALIGGLFNTSIAVFEPAYTGVLALRFTTGFCLAGIYPVGMKIAADYFPKGLGKALGFLLGALAVGTAFPHLVRSVLAELPWQSVLYATSGLCVLGGILVLFLVPDGPYRKRAMALDLSASFKVFGKKEFRAAAFGYFGHMWELYAFWAFVPVLLVHYQSLQGIERPTSLLAFLVLSIGGVSCVLGGYLSARKGSAKVAFMALTGSGLCCLMSPVMFEMGEGVFVMFLLTWGFLVIADSPQFSTLVASTAPRDNTATALTIVNCVGFSISVVSIQLLNWLNGSISTGLIMLFLIPGPLLGLIGMRAVLRNDPTQLSNQ